MRLLGRLLLVFLLLAGGWKVFRQLRGLQAASGASSPEGLREALRWDDEAATTHFRLGRLLRDSLAFRDLEAAAIHLRRAAELNPFDWLYHLELGIADELLGNIEAAEASLTESLRLNPRSGSSFWQLANFYLRHRETERAAKILGAAVEADHGLAAAAFGQLRKANLSFGTIDRIWPEDPKFRLSLLRLGLAEAAANTGSPPPPAFLEAQWERLVTEPGHLSVSQGTPFINYLLRLGESQAAKHRWIELNLLNGVGDREYELGENLVWNGSFELPASRSNLDWRLGKTKTYSAALVSEGETAGSRALRVDFFGGENLDFAGAQQAVVVPPGKSLRLQCRMQSRELTTREGPFLQVLDQSYRQLAATSPILGSQAWATHEIGFRVPDDHRILYLRIRRQPSRRIDSRISGALWLDEVKLAPVPESAP